MKQFLYIFKEVILLNLAMSLVVSGIFYWAHDLKAGVIFFIGYNLITLGYNGYIYLQNRKLYGRNNIK